MKRTTSFLTSNSMEFKFKSNIFKNTAEDHKKLYGEKYDPNKPYPQLSRTLSIPKSQLPMLVEYLHYALRSGELDVDDYLNEIAIPLKISGYQNKSEKTGVSYLALSYEPNYKVLMAAKEAKSAAAEEKKQSTSVDSAAATLAEGTAGQVVEPKQDDFF